MSTPHRKRVRSYNIPGHAHELTFSCYQRLQLLSKDEPAVGSWTQWREPARLGRRRLSAHKPPDAIRPHILSSVISLDRNPCTHLWHIDLRLQKVDDNPLCRCRRGPAASIQERIDLDLGD